MSTVELRRAAKAPAPEGAGRRPVDREPSMVTPVRRRALELLSEPLLHFMVIGLLIFGAAHVWRARHDAHRIEVTPERVADLITKYRLQFGAAPDARQLTRLIDSYVDEEVLYREGVAQGLDRDDEIVRRRVAQKTQFLQQELPPPEPTDAQLRHFFEVHAADYASPARYTFSHLYFSPQHDGPEGARRRAAAALVRLDAGIAPARIAADAFPDLNSYAAVGTAEVQRIFGPSPLVAAMPKLPVGRWAGPLSSTYGWHLVRLEAVAPPSTPALAEVRDRVRADYFDEAQKTAQGHALAAARARYTIVREDLGRPAR